MPVPPSWKCVGSVANHEAIDDAARAERQHAVAASAEFDRRKTCSGIDRLPELKTAPLPLTRMPVEPAPTLHRAGVDDGIAAAETGDVDADGQSRRRP